MSQSIQPLRIQKNTPSSSPSKMGGMATHRPLAELSPMEKRRNSPSYSQITKKPMFQQDSSPFDPSPQNTNTTRSYWQSRDPGSPTRANNENNDPLARPPSQVKRSSIENLKRASRVKNSNMFAREQMLEYDPASSPLIERPLASGRPLNGQGPGIGFGGRAAESPKRESFADLHSNGAAIMSKSQGLQESPKGRSAGQMSPNKSSLSTTSKYSQSHAFDPQNGIWSDEEDGIHERKLPPGRSLHRHAKSVTFDAAPPQIQEYEMTTPDPSSIASGSRDGSHDSADDDAENEFECDPPSDHDDSFDASLEDANKTPVVLPEDWRFMSPEVAKADLANHIDNPFHEEPSNSAGQEFGQPFGLRFPQRTDSAASSVDTRPLPPLPATMRRGSLHQRSESKISFSGTAERISNSQRSSPVPPHAATISKAELQGMGGCSMPIEERLKLMMIDSGATPKSATDEQRERRLRRGSPARAAETSNHESDQMNDESLENDDLADLGTYDAPPKISRASILRKVKEQRQDTDAWSSALTTNYGPNLNDLDPDVPLPTTELGSEVDVIVKKEPSEDGSEVDVYSIPDLYAQHATVTDFDSAMDKLHALKEQRDFEMQNEDDDGSHYSTDSTHGPAAQTVSAHISDEEEAPQTPKASSDERQKKEKHRMSLPQFAALLGDQELDFGAESFMDNPENGLDMVANDKHDQLLAAQYLLANPESQMTLVEHFEPTRASDAQYATIEEPGTPDSVIRHSLAESPRADSPSVPEPVATIKASGSKLKTRPSATPADIRAMAEARRQVSSELPCMSRETERSLGRPSIVAEANESSPEISDPDRDGQRPTKRKSSLVSLNVSLAGSDSLNVEHEFDRLLEAKKKGYLTRQNTKVIVASSASHESVALDTQDEEPVHARGTRSAGNSPNKGTNSQAWTTEPWNGRVRRKSIRKSGGIPSRPINNGPAPPMPGMPSNVATGLDSVNENEAVGTEDDIGDDGERGRLFIKVLRVKDLDLPMPKGERSYFALTLDNGLHCVTTSWLELGKTAPIGQEFELVVLNELEFQLTLQTKLEEPRPEQRPESPTKLAKASKTSAFSRVFASPRKRKEMELKQQEDAQRLNRQREADAQTSRNLSQPSAWELHNKLVAKDGSFARSYVCLKDHEASAFGKPYTVDVPCFNEWATDDDLGPNSARSKRSTQSGNVQRRPPYKIGKLELQLMYIPKPKGARDEDMPKSMNACVRELKEAEKAGPTKWEGHLSQQGGDCPYWRRRFFSLDGSKFTAYHEATRQPRATINLAKASKLIDDKSSLMNPGKKNRRKSAFAEEEEGYMFVEEGFRMRFANGETIDFYADSATEKDGWMKALAEVVGKDIGKAQSWTQIVLAKQRDQATLAQKLEEPKVRSTNSIRGKPASPTKASVSSAKSGPATPAKSRHHPLPVPERSPRRSDIATAARRSETASKTRSMIF